MQFIVKSALSGQSQTYSFDLKSLFNLIYMESREIMMYNDEKLVPDRQKALKIIFQMIKEKISLLDSVPMKLIKLTYNSLVVDDLHNGSKQVFIVSSFFV